MDDVECNRQLQLHKFIFKKILRFSVNIGMNVDAY